MQERTLTCEVTIQAKAERVYDVLTTADGLSRWWDAPIARDLAVGARADLPLGPHVTLHIRVDRLEQATLVAWTCVGGVPEWTASRLRFDLEQRDSATALQLTHTGWQWRAESGALASSGFSWQRHLTRVQSIASSFQERRSTHRSDRHRADLNEAVE